MGEGKEKCLNDDTGGMLCIQEKIYGGNKCMQTKSFFVFSVVPFKNNSDDFLVSLKETLQEQMSPTCVASGRRERSVSAETGIEESQEPFCKGPALLSEKRL